MRPLDVQRLLDVPVGVYWRLSAAGKDDLKVAGRAGGRRRQAELAGENAEIARRRRVVVGIDNGDGVGAARGVGGHGVGVASRHDRRHQLIDAAERSWGLIEIPADGWASLRR